MSGSVSVNECQAIRYLYADGWTYAELRLTFGRTSTTIADHVKGRCRHPDVAAPKRITTSLDGDELREARRNAGLTQSELADRIDVSQGTISQWETGRETPGTDRIVDLRAALKDGGRP